jgi:HSP20 family protein
MNDLSVPTAPASAEQLAAAPTLVPPADIIETESTVVMLLDMPGAEPGSLDVTLDKRVLNLSAQSEMSEPAGYTLLHAEYSAWRYERSFLVSDRVDGERIDAVLKDGVLKLTLPKSAPSPAKKITVRPA